MARLALDQAFDRGSLPQMRKAVARCAVDMGATPVQADHLVLVASELVTNAIAYAGGSGRIKLWLNGTALYCQVSDEGPGISAPSDLGIRRPPPQALSGRGLWVARSLAETIDIETGPSGTSVTVMVRINSP
jgi:anti-sigma regulatory factor (Ser/Thr protein kinase)